MDGAERNISRRNFLAIGEKLAVGGVTAGAFTEASSRTLFGISAFGSLNERLKRTGILPLSNEEIAQAVLHYMAQPDFARLTRQLTGTKAK